MKKIYFIRHAKAVEEGESDDFERDLSGEGGRDICQSRQTLR